MPSIPLQTQQSEFSKGDASYQNIASTPQDFGAAIATGEQEVGRSLDQASNVIAENALRFQAIQNETDVNNTLANQFSPAFRDQYQKYYALQGKDAVDQFPDFMVQMEQLRMSTRDSLPNPVQQRMFDELSRKRTEMEFDGMARYADTQNKVYRDTTHQATLKSYQDGAADKYNDPTTFDNFANSARVEIENYAMQTGKSTEVAKQKYSEWIGEARTGQIERQLFFDPIGAEANYVEHYHDIPAQARVILESKLKTSTNQVYSRTDAMAAVSGAATSKINTTGTLGNPTVIDAIAQQESKGQQFKPDGSTVTSPKGALGIMQVLPSTAKEVAAGLGIPYDEKKLKTDAEYNRTLGTEYFNQQLKAFNGNQTLALAAYNAGPPTVAKWVKKFGDPSKGEISDADFIAKIPYAETKDYVTKISANVAQGGGGQTVSATGASTGRPQTAADVKATLQDAYARADQIAEQRRPGDPVYRDLVRSEVTRTIGQQTAALTAIQQQNHQVVMNAIIGGPEGQETKPTSYDDLRSSNPQAAAAYLNSTPEAQRGYIAAMDQNLRKANGELSKSNTTLVSDLFAKIHAGEIATEAQIAPYFYKGLNKTDYDWLKKEIVELRTPDGEKINDMRNRFFQGLKPTFEGGNMLNIDKAGASRVYTFQQTVYAKEQQLRKEGKDPFSIYRPTSPDYMGKPEDVQSFIPDSSAQMQNNMNVLTRQNSATQASAAATAPKAAALPPQNTRIPGVTRFNGHVWNKDGTWHKEGA